MPSIPRLLYHNLSPPLYPEGDSNENVLAIRFPTPVRVQSLRIVPEGVQSINGIGSTYPTVFSAKVFLNTSPSEPVNALTASGIDYDGQEGWEQDYEIGMPEGVSTRLILVVGESDRLSISVYGYDTSSGQFDQAEIADHGVGEISDDAEMKVKEDWSWISEWAGGVNGLLDMMDESEIDQMSIRRRQKALECLELQLDVDPTVLDLVVDHPTALSYLLLLPSFPPQPILQRLMRDAKFALHPNVRTHLSPKHIYRPLVNGTEEARRRAAWRLMPDLGAVIVLREIGVGDWDVEVENGLSRMGKLMEILKDWRGDVEGYEMCLDLLYKSLEEGGRDRPLRERYLARIIPGLVVKSRSFGSDRALNVTDLYKREVLDVLAEVMLNSTSPSTRSNTIQLAKPCLLEPYDRIFAPLPAKMPPSSPSSSTDSEQRGLERFIISLDNSEKPNAYVHSLTPSQILSTIAPNLLESLSSARNPPFGIPNSSSSYSMGIGGSSASATGTGTASAFAGKVYSSHEFRTREATKSGTGTGMNLGGSGAGMGANMETGMGMISGAGGLGVNALKASRPASRHVDEYAR